MYIKKMDTWKKYIVVYPDDLDVSRSEASHPPLPPLLQEVYEFIANDSIRFCLERVCFRRRKDIVGLHFADEILSASHARQWMYDGTVVYSSPPSVEYSMELFLKEYSIRAQVQQNMADARYQEKCVDGRYIPTPEVLYEPSLSDSES